MKPANGAGASRGEWVERRVGAEGNADQDGTPGHRAGPACHRDRDRVRKAARQRRKGKFTALLHHIDAALLRWSYHWLKRDAAPGVDGVTWKDYGEGLEAKLRDLQDRVHRGRLPGAALRRALHPEAGRPATAARHRGAGGQDRPAGGGRGAECDLRGGLPRVQLRVPAGTGPARRAGRAGGGDRDAGR